MLKGRDFLVKCGDAIVKRVFSVRYLGVILDERLSFREHAVSILKKATGKLEFFTDEVPALIAFLVVCSAAVPGISLSWRSSRIKRDLAILQKMVRFV